MKTLIIIPARYQSSRLPGKPLIKLHGISMIRRTFNRCLQAFPREDIIVATDDSRIQEHCEEINIPVMITSKDCLTGTDRVAEVANKIDADIYINVQGDEPVIDPNDILKIYDVAKNHPDEIINGMCCLVEEDMYRSTSIPKVVTRIDGRLLYMSRAAIPTTKKIEFKKAFRQICIYAFPKKVLKIFSDTKKKTLLEEIEDIEILRFLELGYDIRMVLLSNNSIAVDTPEDIERVETAIIDRGLLNAG